MPLPKVLKPRLTAGNTSSMLGTDTKLKSTDNSALWIMILHVSITEPPI